MYTYHICTPNNHNKPSNSKWSHTYYSKIILSYLKTNKNWKNIDKVENADFTDCYPFGKIKCRISLKLDIFTKIGGANVFKNMYYYPQTFVISPNKQIKNSQYLEIIKELKETPDEIKTKSKWFLKVNKSGGGLGVRPLLNMVEWKKYVKENKKYILQKGVDSLLINGKKFDIRMYLLCVIDHNKQFHLYLSKDGYLRISASDYDLLSVKKDDNLTNVTYQKKNIINQPGKTLVDLCISFSKYENYNNIFIKMCEISRDIKSKLNKILKTKMPTVALLGADFILDKEMNVFLLELNRNIGFSLNTKPIETKKMIRETVQNMIPLAYEPIIRKQILVNESAYWIEMN